VIPAVERVLALVSGFPGERRNNRQLLMLQAFIDGSGTGSGDVLVLAGYIASANAWIGFTEDWQRLLDYRSPHYRMLSYFKMKEMKSSPEDLERCAWFYRVIEKHVLAAVSCTVSVSDLVKAVQNFPWPVWINEVHVLNNPYYFAFKAITDMLAQHQSKLGITEPVDFVFDNESEKKRCIEAWDELKQNSRPDVRALMGDTPIYRDDKTALPLQAADLYAYWVRQWELDGIEDGIEHLEFPWKAERDLPRIDFKFVERDFIAEFNKVFDPEVQRRMGLIQSTALRSNWGASGWTGESLLLKVSNEADTNGDTAFKG